MSYSSLLGQLCCTKAEAVCLTVLCSTLVWRPVWFGSFVGSYGRLNQLVTAGSAGRASSSGEAVRAMLSAAHRCDSGASLPPVSGSDTKLCHWKGRGPIGSDERVWSSCFRNSICALNSSFRCIRLSSFWCWLARAWFQSSRFEVQRLRAAH